MFKKSQNIDRVSSGMNDTFWHKCPHILFPRRTVNSGWTSLFGQTWRRRRPDGRWEYQQDKETIDEALERTW